jgi:hypothetical protein
MRLQVTYIFAAASLEQQGWGVFFFNPALEFLHESNSDGTRGRQMWRQRDEWQ